MFGELAFFTHEPRSLDVVAITGTSLYYLDKESMARVLQHDLALYVALRDLVDAYTSHRLRARLS